MLLYPKVPRWRWVASDQKSHPGWRQKKGRVECHWIASWALKLLAASLAVLLNPHLLLQRTNRPTICPGPHALNKEDHSNASFDGRVL